MTTIEGTLRIAFGIAALAVSVVTAVVAGGALQIKAEGTNENAMTSVELERRPIPGTDLEMRLNLVTQPPGYSEPVDYHSAPGFVYMLEGEAEGFYGEDDIKHFRTGDHWPQSIDSQRVARNPDTKAARRFLVFTVTRPGAAGSVRP